MSSADINIRGPEAGSLFRDKRFVWTGEYVYSKKSRKQVKVWRLIDQPTEEMNVMILVDASGSMWERVKETVKGVRAFVEEQEEGVRVSLATFDTQYGFQLKVDKVQPSEFKFDSFRTYSTTPLYDNISNAIDHVSDCKNVIVVIVTDGFENASRRYTKTSIMQRIRECQNKGWEFISIGSGFDVVEAHKGTGIKSGTTVQAQSFERALKRTGQKVNSYRKSGLFEDLQYSASERAELK